jgi:hypothetical protein
VRTAKATVAALVAMAVPAAAEPRCEVHFVRAPNAVRHTIEVSLAAQAQCTGTIWLRVIPTEGEYYVLGTWADGRIREQAVFGEASVGTLVASWLSEGGVAGPRSGASAHVSRRIAESWATGGALASVISQELTDLMIAGGLRNSL